MNANRKLTTIIKGRTITGVAQQGDQNAIDITLDDNSKMHIKTGTGTGQIDAKQMQGRAINHVQQDGTTLRLVGADDTSIDISLAEATSSVMVRDKNNQLEYAD